MANEYKIRDMGYRCEVDNELLTRLDNIEKKLDILTSKVNIKNGFYKLRV